LLASYRGSKEVKGGTERTGVTEDQMDPGKQAFPRGYRAHKRSREHKEDPRDTRCYTASRGY